METYHAATAAFVLSADPTKTKVLVEGQNGGRTLGDGVLIEGWVNPDEMFVVNVIGEPLKEMPDWRFYENGACEKEIDGAMTLADTETVTLKELVFLEYEEDSGILEHDWYNAVVQSMNDAKRLQIEADTVMMAVWKDYFTSIILSFSIIPMLRWSNSTWFEILVGTFGGKMLIILMLIMTIVSAFITLKINKPL